MNKRIYQAGFSVIEVLLVLVILGLIGFIGWFMYTTKKNTDTSYSNASKSASSITANTKRSSDPYAGWKTYTLKYEKLTMKYPANWTVSYNSTAGGHDDVTLAASDGFSFNFIDGVQAGGDPLPLVTNDPVPVTFLGSQGYLVFEHPKVAQADGPSVPDTSTVGYAIFLRNATDPLSVQADKNVIGSPKYNGVNGPEGSYMFISMGYGGKKNLPIATAKKDAEYNNAKLIIQSMHY